MSVVLTPADWPGHWVGTYREDDVEFRLDATCACGGAVVVLYCVHGQRRAVCTECPGVFPDPALEPWAAAGRRFL